MRPASSVDPARDRPSAVTLWSALVVTCGMHMAWHFIHTHNKWPWLSEQGIALWYATSATAVSSLQPPHQQQHDSWDSTKWQVAVQVVTRHPASPHVAVTRSSRTQTYRIAYTYPFIVNKLQRAWLPFSCAPLKEDCCHVWIDLLLWAAVLKDENHQISLLGTAVGRASQPSSSSLLFFDVPDISFLCAEKSQYNSSYWFTVTMLVCLGLYMLFWNKRLVVYGNRLLVCWIVAFIPDRPAASSLEAHPALYHKKFADPCSIQTDETL